MSSPSTPFTDTLTHVNTYAHTHILSRFPGRNRSRSGLKGFTAVGGGGGGGGLRDEGVCVKAGSVAASAVGGPDESTTRPPNTNNDDDDDDHNNPRIPPHSPILNKNLGVIPPPTPRVPSSNVGLDGFSFPPIQSDKVLSSSPYLPISIPTSSSSSSPHPPSDPIEKRSNHLPLSMPPTTTTTLSSSPTTPFPAISRKALVIRGETDSSLLHQRSSSINDSREAGKDGSGRARLHPPPSGLGPSSGSGSGSVRVGGNTTSSIDPHHPHPHQHHSQPLGGLPKQPAAAYGHLTSGHGMFKPDLGIALESLSTGGRGGKKSGAPSSREEQMMLGGGSMMGISGNGNGTGYPGQGQTRYIPEPPMTLADRRRTNQGGGARVQDGPQVTRADGQDESKSDSERHRFPPFSLSFSRRRRQSADDDRRGSRGPLRHRRRRWNRSTESISKPVESSRTTGGRRRMGGAAGSDEIQESESDRKRREAESVIAWKVWAAACVASNTVPIDLDLFRSPTPCTTPMTARPTARPRLAVRPPSAGDGPPRSLYDSSSTISTEDAIISPSTEPDGPSWAAPGKRPLVHSLSMDEMTGIKHVEGRNHSMPDISILGTDEPGRNRTRSSRHHQRRSTKMLVSGSMTSVRTSATPSPEPRLNSLLPLRSRLSNKHVRAIALELVHALSSFTELRSQLDDNDAESTVIVLPAWSRRALDAARAQGLLDPPTSVEAKFQDAEIIALFRDLDEVIGYPGYVSKMLITDSEFHSVVFGEPRRVAVLDKSGYSLQLATCDRILRDLEEVLWGSSEPHPDDIAYGTLVLSAGNTHPSLIDAIGAHSSSAISSSLFDILAEPVPIPLSHARDTEDLRETCTAAMRKQSLFANLTVSRGNSIVYVPGVSTFDIANFKIASSGRNSVDLLEQAARATPEVPKTRTAEDLAQEGRARYEAWQKSRQVQPLKRS